MAHAKSILGAIVHAERIFEERAQFADNEAGEDSSRIQYHIFRFKDGTYEAWYASTVDGGHYPTSYWKPEMIERWNSRVLIATLYAWNGSVL